MLWLIFTTLLALGQGERLGQKWGGNVYDPPITAANPCAEGEPCKNKDINMLEVDKLMLSGGGEGDSDKPSCFKGLFWMQGNPASDDVASFYGSKFEDMSGKPGWPKKFKKSHSEKEAKDKAAAKENS